MSNLQLFIRRNGLTQKQVADYLCVSETWISNICKGKSDLGRKSLERLLNNSEGWDVSPLSEGSYSDSIAKATNTELLEMVRRLQEENIMLLGMISNNQTNIC